MTTRMVRSGRSPVITADDRLVLADGPDVFAHVHRSVLRVAWSISYGPFGEDVASGRTWTKSGARLAAIAAAHRPGGA